MNDETGFVFNKVGYAPSIDALSDGDYISFEIDVGAGVIQNWIPLTLDEIKAACGIEEEESEDNEW